MMKDDSLFKTYFDKEFPKGLYGSGILRFPFHRNLKFQACTCSVCKRI